MQPVGTKSQTNVVQGQIGGGLRVTFPSCSDENSSGSWRKPSRAVGIQNAVFGGMNDCKKHNSDLLSSAVAAVSLTAIWYALVFVTDVSRPRALPNLPPIWTILAGLCPCIGTIFAVLMLLMRRRGGRINAALFYGVLAASLTPWLFWASL